MDVHDLLVNLLQNGAEAMPEGGTITVRTENRDGGGEWVRLTVADEGPGIAADILPRVAEPFLSTRQRHNGIGLTLCEDLLGRQGGRLTIANESPGEACVSMDLPRYARADEEDAARRLQ